jgi:hypothetical protein
MIAALARALEIAERLDDAEYRLRVLHEQYAFRLVTGAYREALAVAGRFVDAAAGTADPVDTLIGRRMVGLMLHVLGDQAGARRHVEALDRVDLASARRAHIVRYQFDQRVVTQSVRARIAWLEGYPAQALQDAESAVQYAGAGDHRASLFYALMLTACPIALHVGDTAAADRYVARFHELAAAQSLAAWATWPGASRRWRSSAAVPPRPAWRCYAPRSGSCRRPRSTCTTPRSWASWPAGSARPARSRRGSR